MEEEKKVEEMTSKKHNTTWRQNSKTQGQREQATEPGEEEEEGHMN